jgi:hypothetical protein
LRYDSFGGGIVRKITEILTNNINPSGVHVVPQPSSYTLVPSIPAISPNNSDENSEEELLNIAGKSIFDHDKIHGK